MILITVGTQLPFERLIKQVDAWASAHPDVECFAQIGETKYKPKAMPYAELLTPLEYQNYFERATMLISHVGMGTIISGLEAGKPLILMPRKADLGEHRSDHQFGTAKKFSHHRLISVVEEQTQLNNAIDSVLAGLANDDSAEAEKRVELDVSPKLIQVLRDFIA